MEWNPVKISFLFVREAATPSKRGGGFKGQATKEKRTFLSLKKNPKKMWPLTRGALVAVPLKKTFFATSLSSIVGISSFHRMFSVLSL